jgi:hypothetical protein
MQLQALRNHLSIAGGDHVASGWSPHHERVQSDPEISLGILS